MRTTKNALISHASTFGSIFLIAPLYCKKCELFVQKRLRLMDSWLVFEWKLKMQRDLLLKFHLALCIHLFRYTFWVWWYSISIQTICWSYFHFAFKSIFCESHQAIYLCWQVGTFAIYDSALFASLLEQIANNTSLSCCTLQVPRTLLWKENSFKPMFYASRDVHPVFVCINFAIYLALPYK